MCKQGAYEAGRRRQKEENYKEKLYRRLKQQWIGPYKPFDVDDDWNRQYYPEEYGSNGVYMARDCAYVEERCREHKNKELFGYVDYGYSDLFKPAVEKMLVTDFKQQVKELFESHNYSYNHDDDIMLGCDALDVEWIKRTYGYDLDDELRKWQEEEEFDESLKVLLDDFSAEDY